MALGLWYSPHIFSCSSLAISRYLGASLYLSPSSSRRGIVATMCTIALVLISARAHLDDKPSDAEYILRKAYSEDELKTMEMLHRLGKMLHGLRKMGIKIRREDLE